MTIPFSPPDIGEKEIEEVVPTDVVVVTTKTGLIKKVPVSSFKLPGMTLLGVLNTKIKITARDPGAAWTEEARQRCRRFKDHFF